ncbi:MAG: RNA 2',3'-cyclic phosphodiesterase [Syntrophomonas sp.]|uniref:RNA 2',3'-cyclic phosphodiesterase n=1 Tax=Syntrophomonas sp. TaxID=2053627 RepID=UPI0026126D3C|nr:RNA 2',3'-cyclic phosphodiesterase [Syntrophomonas sp.]MDD2509703.1 RNA 2',3'-cyclic phosphodiesterase [Syntrophomonas sp.]MDD4625835.1 RNA 2',3'-cyclic phosphodiesterase [Syntrophomonas sp.]
MRAFLAITVPDYLKDYAFSIKKQLVSTAADVKWVERENYHLTLKFLGEIKPELTEKIKQDMESVADSCPILQLRVNKLGVFPNQKRPRVIWLGIEGEMEKLNFLGERVDAHLYILGFEPEKRRSFHLTLGRIRSESNKELLLQQLALINREVENISFPVHEFQLMESQLSSRGPTYLLHKRFMLRG